MKKILFILSAMVLLNTNFIAQNTEPVEKKQEDFDKKFRFGLRVSPQPSWLKSNNDNSKGAGSVFGFGFGLMFDIKLSGIIRFSTGLGGDFEGGYIKYKHVSDLANPANDFQVNVLIDKENNMVEAKDGKSSTDYEFVNGSTQYVLNDRRYKSTFVTIPLLLKMMTQEYSGLKYFFNFGGELGIRAGVKANDTYISGLKTNITGTTVTTEILTGDNLKRDNINVGKDASLAPFRVGMNLGFGIEYRLGGSTSLVTSVNYFQAFTNLMRNDSKYLTKGVDNTYTSANGWNFASFNQGYFARAVRINIGLMF